MKKKPIAITIAAAAAVAALALALGGGKTGAPAKAGQGAPGGQSQASGAKAVKTVAAAAKTLRPYLDESGDVEASVNVAVYPDIGGKLVAYKVAIGDAVRKGQAIATVDPSKPGSSYALSAVESPITGTVTAILAQPGETLSSSTPIAKVGVIDDLKISLDIPERDSTKPEAGMTAIVSFEAMPGESFKARVAKVSPVLDPTSRTREITLAFPDLDPRICAGMYAKVRLYLDPIAGRLVVPSASVIVRDGESFVFVAAEKDGKAVASKRVVKTGASVDDEVAVVSGLAAGDEVVCEGQDSVSDGAEISVSNGAEK